MPDQVCTYKSCLDASRGPISNRGLQSEQAYVVPIRARAVTAAGRCGRGSPRQPCRHGVCLQVLRDEAPQVRASSNCARATDHYLHMHLISNNVLTTLLGNYELHARDGKDKWNANHSGFDCQRNNIIEFACLAHDGTFSLNN